MRQVSMKLVALGFILALLVVPIGAQDYRARVQGVVTDESQAAVPGATVTLINEATGVSVFKVTDPTGRYLFDFVEPGVYTVTAELTGFKKSERKGIRVQQRADVAANLTLSMGTLNETVTVVAETTQVQLNSGNQQMTIESQLIDQMPLNGRNPYNLAMLDPTMNPGVGTTANENRPFHHAFANDYDAGGGTRRANDVLLDGVPLNASYKTAYTPSMDAVEEITISKTSADAENGNSLGGIISLNMKSGTNNFRGTAYYFFRDPSLNAVSDPTLAVPAGKEPIRGTKLKMGGATFGGPILKNKLFTFTSYEQWDDNRPISIVRTVPTDLERAGDFSQSTLSGRVRTIYNPYTSTIDPVTKRVVRTPFTGNVIPAGMIDPVSAKILAEMPRPNVAGNTDNLQYNIYENTQYWNFSERIDWNISDNWKIFARYGQFKANLYQQNPTDAGYFPLSGSNRYGMSAAADAVWVMSNNKTLNIRGSYYNMTDEFYNPSLLLGEEGLQDYWPNNPWYSSLYNSGYVYYPALDVTSGTGTAQLSQPPRPPGPRVVPAPERLDDVGEDELVRGQAQHEVRRRGAFVLRPGGPLRADQPLVQLDSDRQQLRTAPTSSTPATSGPPSCWAACTATARRRTGARLVPLQTPDSRGYGAYFQDDFRVSDRLTLNMGLRWEYEPGSTDAENRLSQRYDLTQPIPEMQTTPPTMNATALSLMASKGYTYTYNGAWVFTTKENPNVVHITPWNFLPRFGAAYKIDEKGDQVIRFAYGRYLRSYSAVRETLGDYVNQYTGYAQTTADARPRQRRPAADPGRIRIPSAVNPVVEPYGQAYGRYTGLGGAISLDEYEQRPQINDRINLSYQRRIWLGIIADVSYFYNYGSRVPYDINLNMMDPAFRYEQKAAITRSVPNPFLNYLTVDKFPGSLRNAAHGERSAACSSRTRSTGAITQANTNGRNVKTQTLELRAQRPFVKGLSFVASYAYNYERRQEWFDDLAQYKVLTSGGKDGWEWRPTADVPTHRFTGAVTWQIPVGKGRAFGSTMPTALDYVVGGWRYLPGHALVLRSAAAVHDQLRRHGKPQAREPDARQLVRHVDVLAGRYLHAAHQPVLLRWPRWPELVGHRHDADQGVQPRRPLPARGAHRGLQRVRPDLLG